MYPASQVVPSANTPITPIDPVILNTQTFNPRDFKIKINPAKENHLKAWKNLEIVLSRHQLTNKNKGLIITTNHENIVTFKVKDLWKIFKKAPSYANNTCMTLFYENRTSELLKKLYDVQTYKYGVIVEENGNLDINRVSTKVKDSGATCSIHDVLSITYGKERVLKKTKNNSDDEQARAFAKEASTMSLLNPDGQAVGLMKSPVSTGYGIILMEKMYNGLHAIHGRKPLVKELNHKVHICYQLIAGAYYFSKMGWVIQDIKPENCLIDKIDNSDFPFVAALADYGGHWPLEDIHTRNPEYTHLWVTLKDTRKASKLKKEIDKEIIEEKKNALVEEYQNHIQSIARFSLGATLYTFMTPEVKNGNKWEWGFLPYALTKRTKKNGRTRYYANCKIMRPPLDESEQENKLYCKIMKELKEMMIKRPTLDYSYAKILQIILNYGDKKLNNSVQNLHYQLLINISENTNKIAVGNEREKFRNTYCSDKKGNCSYS